MAIKTSEDIERDFYTYVKNSQLGQSIDGSVYRSEMRPANAKTEDIIVKFLDGTDAQIQTGIILLNIYIPDVKDADGNSVIDHSRVAELQTLARSFVDSLTSTEYKTSTDGTPTSQMDEDIKQHLLCVRIYFKRYSDD